MNRWLVVAGIVAGALSGCGRGGGGRAEKQGAALVTPAASEADRAEGERLATTFECARCHERDGFGAPSFDKQCVGCHAEITAGRFPKDDAEANRRWHDKVSRLDLTPSLRGTERLRRDFIAGYLLAPHDLRPGLVPEMPRLALTPDQASKLAAFLSPDEQSDEPSDRGDVARGKSLLTSKGCLSCHVATGLHDPAPSPLPPGIDGDELRRAMALAPDLRFARDRLSAVRLTRWVRNPSAEKFDAVMPRIALTDGEVEDLAAFLLRAPLAPPPARPTVDAPPVEAHVSYAQVDAAVFHRACWHCHSEPDYARGNGGPGNSGGFGFAPKRLNLSSYEGIMSGWVDAQGKRRSVFEATDDGTPRLVKALWARHDEEAGAVADVRGMPLGMPPLDAADIRLVEAWVAQGRPR